jgi:hypothetical protein
MRVYAPEGVPMEHKLTLNPLPRAGSELRIGILHNNKANAGLLLTTAATELAAALGAPPPVLTSKERASLPATPQTYERLHHEADLVLVGSAD